MTESESLFALIITYLLIILIMYLLSAYCSEIESQREINRVNYKWGEGDHPERIWDPDKKKWI